MRGVDFGNMNNLNDSKKKHFCKVTDIRIKTNLSAIDALEIAEKYHEKYKIPGEIDLTTMKSIFFDEEFYMLSEPAWIVKSKLEQNTFEGMDFFYLVVSDNKRIVEYVLDHNGGLI